MKGLKFLPENNRRHRYLSVQECDRLLQACISPRVRAIVAIALHTGMRLGEILNLCFGDINFPAGLILIRDSKNGQPRHIPMDATVLDLLTNYPRHPTSDLVFANGSGTTVNRESDSPLTSTHVNGTSTISHRPPVLIANYVQKIKTRACLSHNSSPG